MDETDRLKQRFLNMPEKKQQRICAHFVELFARLEADWKAKPEHTGKPVPYRKPWDDYSRQNNDGEQGVAGYPPQDIGSPGP